MLAAVLLTVVLLTACGGAGPAGSGLDSTGSESVPGAESPEPEFGTPTPEDTDRTEEAAPTQASGVSIDVAGLPIGGFSTPDEDDPFLRCVLVVWTGLVEVPPGVSLELTSTDLQPEGLYETTEAGCPGDDPPCLNVPGVLDGTGGCRIAVRQVLPSTDGFGSLGAGGRVSCESETWRCTEFESQLAAAGPPERIEWDDAVVGEPDPGGTDAGTGSATSDGAGR